MRMWKTALSLGVALGTVLATAAMADTTLNLLVIDGTDATGMKAVADAYHAAHPDVTVNIQAYPFAQYFQVAELRLRSKDPSIDLVYTDAPLVASYGSQNFLSPIDKSLDLSTLTKTSIDAGTYKGTVFALPINSSAQVMFYNKKLFADAGLTPPDGLTPGASATQADIDTLASSKRWTWEQVADAAQKLTKKDGGRTITYGFTVEQFAELYQLQPFGESLGTDVIGPDGYTAKGYLDSDAWMKAGEFWSDLYNKWGVSPKSLGYGEAAQLFNNGKLAMLAGGTWNVPGIAAGGVDFGVAPYPYFKGGKVLTPTGSWYMAVSAASSHQAEAMDFAKYLTIDKAGAEIWFKALNQLPTNTALLDDIQKSPDFDKFPGDVMRLAVYESLHTAKARPVTAAYGQLQDAFRTAFTDISNGVPVKQALDTAVQKFEAAANRVAQ